MSAAPLADGGQFDQKGHLVHFRQLKHFIQ
jgi:hypothetical protein